MLPEEIYTYIQDGSISRKYILLFSGSMSIII